MCRRRRFVISEDNILGRSKTGICAEKRSGVKSYIDQKRGDSDGTERNLYSRPGRRRSAVVVIRCCHSAGQMSLVEVRGRPDAPK